MLFFIPAIVFSAPAIDFRYANRNATSLIGIPDGSRKTQVDTSGTLQTADESLVFWLDPAAKVNSISLSHHLDLGIPLAQSLDLKQRLVGGRYPGIITEGKRGTVALRLTSLTVETSPSPLETSLVEVRGGEADLHATVESPVRLTVQGDTAVDESGAPVWRFASQDPGATVAQLEVHHGDTWHVGTFSSYPSYWGGPPANPADPAFNGTAYGWGGQPIVHRFPVKPGSHYVLALGFRDDWYSGPGHRPMVVRINGRKVLDVDPGTEAPQRYAFVKSLPYDSQADSELEVVVQAAPGAVDSNALLNVIWLFPADGAAVDLNAIRLGQWNQRAIYFAPCGFPESLQALFHFSPPNGSTSSLWVQRPWGAAPDLERWGPVPARRQFLADWDRRYRQGMQIDVPEKTVADFYYASLANILLMRDVRDGFHVLQPGATVYRSFWLRDGSYMASALSTAGWFADARTSLDYFLQVQPPDGGWNSPSTQWDSLGQAPWGLYRYAELSGDGTWLARIFPALQQGVDFTRNARQTTLVQPLPVTGLMIPGWGDGGMGVTDYCLHQNVWALFGEKLALQAARLLGHGSEELAIAREYADYQSRLADALSLSFVSSAEFGYLPPLFLNPANVSWGQGLAALEPTEVLLDNPQMRETVRWLESREVEGIPIGLGWQAAGVWPYAAADLAKGYLRWNERDRAIALFYAIVNHAYPTGSWIEEIDPTTRIGTGDMPHGWAAANHVLLLRDLLLYESNGALVVGAGVPDSWLQGPSPIQVTAAPTAFGPVSVTMAATGGGSVRYRFQTSRSLDVRLPPQCGGQAWQRCDGPVRCERDDDSLRATLPAGSTQLEARCPAA